MRVLIIDNYDSFTYNLYQYIGEILQAKNEPFKIDVFRNDKITLEEIKKAKYDRIVISPGPGDPSDSAYFGVCAKVLTVIGKKTPVLGVCLGMQGMAYYFGGKVIRAKLPMHGKTSAIEHDGKGLFKGLPQNIEVMRYHSLIADPKTLPDCLEISAVVYSSSEEQGDESRSKDFGSSRQARTIKDGEIMGLRHKKYPVEGIQFHPESFATEGGKMILSNFLFNMSS